MPTVNDIPSTRGGTAKNIAWNYAGYLYQIGINLGLTYYIVRRVSVAEYGLLLFVMSLSGTLYLLDAGISNVLVQAYVETLSSSDQYRPTTLLSTAFLALAALGTLGALILTAVGFGLPGPFNIPHGYLREAFIIFVIAGLIVQVSFPSMALEHLFQAIHRFDRINQIQLACSTIQAVLSILALAAGFGIVALASTQLVAAIIRLLCFIAARPKTLPLARLSFTNFSWSLFQPLLKLSRWAFLNNISTYLFDLFVWMVLGSLGSMQEAALFGLAGKPPKQLWNVIDKGAGVALPILSTANAKNDLRGLQETYLKMQSVIFGAIVPFILLGCVFARPLIEVWAGSRYLGAAVVMRWLLVAALAHAITYSSDLLLYACANVKQAAIIASWSGAMGIVCALALVSRFGAAGMAAGIALSQLLVNCPWFTVAACRRSQISLVRLLRALIRGLGLPLFVLTVEIAIVWSLLPRLSPVSIMIGATASGLVYLAIWGAHTAHLLYRSQPGTAAP
jgi:O-antigen/teichoic acid export membrane protein